LSFEEIQRVVGAFVRAGVRKVRLTGGEPLLRHELPKLIALLADLPDLEDIALTTNGSLLATQAAHLRAAGLRRVTVSLDSVDPKVFAELSDTRVPLQAVLDGIASAADVGLSPIKLNAVIQRGVNDAGLRDLADFAREHGHVMRFIEYMDVGESNGWRLDDVVPAAEIVRTLHAAWPLEPVEPTYPGEVASRYRYLDGAGEIGVISSITRPFCSTCTRARLSAVGEVYTCLFATRGTDLRALVRGGASDSDLDEAIRGLWAVRTDNYSEARTAATPGAEGSSKVEMSYIGG
jgi:cyclic pyranopterin phosphate synthase